MDNDAKLMVGGRYDIEYGIYAKIETYITKERNKKKFEVHKEHIDVQYVIIGKGIITTCDAKKGNL